MAFATQNVKLESNGSLWQMVGDCTANVGDANGTINIAGGRVYQATVMDISDTTPATVIMGVKITEGSPSVISINCAGGITKGRFLIVFR